MVLCRRDLTFDLTQRKRQKERKDELRTGRWIKPEEVNRHGSVVKWG